MPAKGERLLVGDMAQVSNDPWARAALKRLERSLASLAREHGLAPPYLIKLDTHGYELPILEGATELFHETSLMVIEAYTFPLRGSGPRFFELADWLAARGFLAIDLSEPMWRPGDGALWQFDLFFVPATRPEFASVRFR
jgi:hypothetical protein